MKAERLHFVDWLRILVVVSLVPFHAAISYVGYGDVYVYDPAVKDFYLGLAEEPGITSVAFDTLIGVLDNFFMHLLFFLSGIGTCFALSRRTSGQYVRERLNKLLLPATFGILCIIPIQSFFRAKNLFDFRGNFLQFYPTFFNGIRGTFPEANFEWAHLWFLVYLLVFSLGALPLFLLFKRPAVAEWLTTQFRNHATVLYLPLAILVFFECLLRPTWPGFQNLYDDWANFSNYLFFMIFGYLFALGPSFKDRLARAWMLNGLVGMACYIMKNVIWSAFHLELGYAPGALVVIACRTAAAYLFVLTALGVGYKFLNVDSPVLRYCKGLAFPLYILHLVLVTILTYYLLDTGWHFYVRFAVVTILSYPAAILLYEILVKRIRPIGWCMGMTVKRSQETVPPGNKNSMSGAGV